MGSKYVEGRSVELFKAYKESSPSTPLFFILSPGVDPLKDLEVLGEPLPRGTRGAAVRAARSCSQYPETCVMHFPPLPRQKAELHH